MNKYSLSRILKAYQSADSKKNYVLIN